MKTRVALSKFYVVPIMAWAAANLANDFCRKYVVLENDEEK